MWEFKLYYSELDFNARKAHILCDGYTNKHICIHEARLIARKYITGKPSSQPIIKIQHTQKDQIIIKKAVMMFGNVILKSIKI